MTQPDRRKVEPTGDMRSAAVQLMGYFNALLEAAEMTSSLVVRP